MGRLLLFLIPALLSSQAPVANQGRLPRLEDYPVPETFTGPAAQVNLRRWEERMFRTRLMEASKQSPDFAGHYRFAIWGCGTMCAAGAIVDLKTGTVYPPPLGEQKGWNSGWGQMGDLFRSF